MSEHAGARPCVDHGPPRPERWAIFSGAGLSGAAPASLPTGFRMRDDLLGLIHPAAASLAPSVIDETTLDLMIGSACKLEVVLGRTWGTVGEISLQCLYALRVGTPNAAHLLAALHLAHGGLHVTVNFDIGIELAFRYLNGEQPLTRPHRQSIGAWRALLPGEPVALRVVAGAQEFNDWLADGRPPALLKLHGSLGPDQTTLIDPVVVDVVELGQLNPARAAAVELLGDFDRLTVAGYAGEDIDVYRPLLASVSRTLTDWRQLDVRASSPVPADLCQRRATLLQGEPDGLASTGLARVLGLTTVPDWPTGERFGEPYDVLFARWATRLRELVPVEDLATAYAWLLADLGDYNRTEAILSAVLRRRPTLGVRFRHADVMYHRFQPDDRERAAWLFLRIVLSVRADRSTRLHAMLRLGDCARTVMRRNPIAAPLALLPAASVLLLTGGGRSEPEMAADAYRALQQVCLRIFERAAPRIPAGSRGALAVACRLASRWGRAGTRLTTNGNRWALITQHRLTLLVLADLLQARAPAADAATRLHSLQDSYGSGNDLPGAGNCAVSLAIHAAACGDLDRAQARLQEARELFARSRADGPPNPTGMAFADVAQRLIDVLARPR